MTRKRTIGSMAAAAGLAVSVAWLTASPAARADELSDLRENMQLLQQRVDQLAQEQVAQFAPGTTGGAAYGAKPAPGTPLLGGSFPRSFLIPGTDTSIRIGGTANEVLDYWFQGGPPNGNPTTDLGANGQALTGPLNFKSTTTASGFPTKHQLVAQPGIAVKGVLEQNLTGVGGNINIQANARGNGIFSQSQLQSDFQVETRTPTAYGEARTFMQFDFAGCDNFSCNNVEQVSTPIIPRIKYFYGTLGGVLAGQANSNFGDNDAGPETIDFGGDVGQAGVVRTAQVRYTYPWIWGSAWSIAIEQPDTDVITPAGQVATETTSPNLPSLLTANAYTSGCIANGVIQGTAANGVTTTPGAFGQTSSCALANNIAMSKAPDITFSSYWAQPWGHVDFRFVFRDLTVNDGHYVDSSLIGYGGGVSGTIIPNWFGWTKDNFVWQFSLGPGIGRYLNDADQVGLETNYGSLQPNCPTPKSSLCPAAGAFPASDIIVDKVFSAGASAGYQHWWLPNLRSNVTGGYVIQDISGALIGPLASVNQNHKVWTTHVNLIWSPVGFIDTGIEYIYSQRNTVAGLTGTQQALIANFIVKF
jgi:hypothetical protein